MDMSHSKHAGHGSHTGHVHHQEHESHDRMPANEQQASHSAHIDHSGHEQLFRNRFWICLALSIPVLLYSPTFQSWLGFSMPAFPGSWLVVPVLSLVIFLYGGVPFLRMAVPEIRNRKPGMMTLISLAIIVAFFYSIAAFFIFST